MKDTRKTKKQLINELVEMRQRVTELEAAETEHKRTEEQLRYQANLLQDVSDAIVSTDMDWVVQSWNKAAERIYGWKAHEALGNPLGELVKPEYPYDTRDVVIQKFIEDGYYEGEVIHHRKDGTPLNILGAVSMLKDRDGNPVGAVSVNRDITERKRSEEALRDAEAKYRTLVEQLPAITYIVEFGEANRTIYISPQVESLLGFSQAEWLADPNLWIKQLHPDDRERVLSEVRRKDASGEPLDLEYRTLTRDGRVLWFRNQTTLVQDETGQIRYSDGLMLDITERKRAEEALRESEERFQRIARVTNDAIWDLDLVTDTVWWNEGVKTLFGYDADEAGSDPIWWRGHIHPEDRERVVSGIDAVIDGDEKFWSDEYRYQRADGSYAHVFDRGYVLDDDSGKPVRMTGGMMDITERKQAEEALELRAEQLTALSQASQAVTASLELDQVLAEVVSLASEVVPSDYTSVVLVDEADHLGQSAENISGVPAIEFRIRDEGLTSWIVRSGQAVVIDEIGEDGAMNPELGQGAPRSANPLIVEAGVKSFTGLPLMVKDRLLGVLYLHSLRPAAFHGQLPLLSAFANQAAIAIENARLHEAVQQELAERKQMAEALRESEERYRRLVEFSPETIAVHSKGKIIYINPAGVELLGAASPEELVGKPIMDFVHPDYKEAIKERVRQSYAQGETAPPIEEKFIRPDKQVVDVATTAVPITYQGEPATLAVVRDITERKRAEEALRQSEEAHRLLFEQSVDGIIIVAKGRIVRANRAFCAFIGLPVERVVGMDPLDLLHYEDRNIAVQRLKAILSGEPVSESQVYRALRSDGSVFWVEVRGRRIEWEGEPAHQSIVRDITERKRAERLLQALNEAALAMERALTHEEIFTAVAEELKKLGFSCMVLTTDESQSRLFPQYLSYETKALKAAERLTGLQREDFSIPIETIDTYRKVIKEKKTVLIESSEDLMRQVLPEPFRRLARQIIRMLKIPKSIPAPLIVEDKVIGLFSVQSDDLTEDDIPTVTAFAHQMAAAWRKAQLMQDLETSLEELKLTQSQLLRAQKMEAIGQLTAGIAHDFNNLLTSIGGFTDIMLREAPEDSQRHEDLRHVQVAAERAAALTRQLRLFTRQEEGKRRPMRLNSVVKETHTLLEHSIPKEITIEVRLEPELWTVEADPSQISQVLMNLCVNARDAMPGGGTLTLETRNVTLDEEEAQAILEARPGRYVRLSVSDTGRGMSPEVQVRLFEPFFTTKEADEGTGLGLAVAYGIVKGHDGFINVHSEVGRGSTFRIYLPVIELAVEEREAEVLALPAGTETILLVDDEEAVLRLGQRVLKRCGYTVLKAENGVQALEVYQAHQEEIALVVLDAVMPKMGGQECLRRLQELDPQVKVLISTGYTADDTAQKLVAEGALGAVEKPFLPRDLAAAVRKVLDKR